MGVLSWSPLAGGWLSGAFGEGKENTSRRSAMLPDRYDLTLPANQQKLAAVIELQKVADEAGHSLIELALAFVLAHPAVTCPIIGPRTMDQLESQLAVADITLDDDVLDRIDEIAPPGQNVGRGRPRLVTPVGRRQAPPPPLGGTAGVGQGCHQRFRGPDVGTSGRSLRSGRPFTTAHTTIGTARTASSTTSAISRRRRPASGPRGGVRRPGWTGTAGRAASGHGIRRPSAPPERSRAAA